METAQFTFSVKTEDICVFCLDSCSDNGTTLNLLSLKKFSHFLKLDYMKIFKIKVPLFPPGKKEENEVDVQVSLCKSCSKLKNKFYDLVQQYEWIMHRLGSCVQTIHETMVNAESNVIRVRKYHQEIGAKRGMTIENTIPERFRKETMQKCLKYSQHPIPPPKIEVKPEAFQAIDKKSLQKPSTSATIPETPASSFRETVIPESSLINFNDGGYLEKSSEDDDDDEKDPEELMLEYDSCSGLKSNFMLYASMASASSSVVGGQEIEVDDDDMIPATEHFEETRDPSFLESQLQQQNESIEDGNNEEMDMIEFEQTDNDDSNEDFSIIADPVDCVVHNEGEPSEKLSFSSKYKCNICGKVVVSLKNFELHQRRHAGEKPFECEICKKTFRDTSNLRSHALRYHRHLLFAKFKSPDVSTEEFSAALECLVMSIRVKIPKDAKNNGGDLAVHNPHGCRLCGKEYTQGYVIEDHVVQRHYTILAKTVVALGTQICRLPSEDLFQYMENLEENGANEERSTCGMCGMEFLSGEEVNLHIKSHIKIKVARNKCDAEKSKVTSYATTGGSTIGMKMKCERCGKYFEDLQGLNRHKILYRNGTCAGYEKTALFACEFCGRHFNSYYNQRAHIVSFHRYEVFSKYLPEGITPSCIESGIKSLLQNYKKLPMGTFECGWCQKEITQLRKLNSHVLVTHFESIVEHLNNLIVGEVEVYQLVEQQQENS